MGNLTTLQNITAHGRPRERGPGRSAYVSDKEVGLYRSGEETIKFDRQERFKNEKYNSSPYRIIYILQ